MKLTQDRGERYSWYWYGTIIAKSDINHVLSIPTNLFSFSHKSFWKQFKMLKQLQSSNKWNLKAK